MAQVNKLVLDEQSEARFTVGGGVLADDKSQVKGWQEDALWITAGAEKGAGMYSQTKSAVDAFLGSKGEVETAGGSPTSKDMEQFEEHFRKVNAVRNEKAAHSAGNYGVTLPSPAKPKTTLRPTSVETRYPE